MTAHRPAQVARHAAIVLAGAASLSLTAAAGAYVVHQIADAQHPDTRLAAPVIPAPPHDPGHGRRAVSYPALTASSSALPATVPAPGAVETDRREEDKPGPVSAPTAPTAPAPLDGEVRLGDAYVGARLAEVEQDTVSVTVDTNAFTVLRSFVVPTPEEPGLTTMRTDIDTRNGEVRLAFSDPKLGEHGLRLNRHSAPTATARPDGDLGPATVGGTADSVRV
ncbi:hypothetical protein ACRS6B_06715 [Nocardia asteroides]